MPPVTPTPGSTDAGPGPAAAATLTVANQTFSDICAVYITPMGGDGQLENRLSAPLAPNLSITLTGFAPGAYNLRAEYCGGQVVKQEYGVLLGDAGFTWAVTDVASREENLAALRVVNNTPETICELFVALSSTNDWGSDRLDTALDPGTEFTLLNLPPGTYDLRVVSCNRQPVATEYFVEIRPPDGYTWLLEGGLTLTIINSSNASIVRLCVCPAGAETPGVNLVAGNPLLPGASIAVTDLEPGTYELRFETGDGTLLKDTVIIREDRTYTLRQ
ncbi:MAG: hypothetical protein Kow00124_16990 [Anaerolineae bacterium]